MCISPLFFVCIVQCGDALNTSLEGVRKSGASGGGGDEALNTSSDSAISTYSAVSTCPSDVTAERVASGKENRQPVAPGTQRQRVVKKTLKTSSRDRSNSSSRTPRGKQQQMAPPAAVPVAVGKKQNTPRGGHAGGAAATTRLPLRNDHNNKV